MAVVSSGSLRPDSVPAYRSRERSFIKTTSETTVLEVNINHPLAEALLRLELKEGVKVLDYRFDLPRDRSLEYVYRASRTADELEALAAAEQARLASEPAAPPGGADSNLPAAGARSR